MRKVVVFVSTPEADRVRDAIAVSGGNRLGNYSSTVYSARATQYSDMPRAIDEERIEFACDDETYAAILSAIDGVLPSYATTIDSWSLETY